jgi:hypothetical protein
MMEAVRTSETSVYSKETTLQFIPEGSHLRSYFLIRAVGNNNMAGVQILWGPVSEWCEVICVRKAETFVNSLYVTYYFHLDTLRILIRVGFDCMTPTHEPSAIDSELNV